jgi:hypothetical protein
MNKDIVIESSDEVVDLGRRSMMSRFGLAASLTLAAPVLMTMSTSTLANHKSKKDRGQGNCESMGGEGGANANAKAIENIACPGSDSPPPPPPPGGDTLPL